MKTYKLNLQPITKEELLNDEARSFNPSEWIKMVHRYSSYGETQFYKVPKDEVYSYDRFYAVYTIPEGIKLFASIGYGSGISDAGFKLCFITPGVLNVNGFGPDCDRGIKNNREGRAWMANASKKVGTIFTNEF